MNDSPIIEVKDLTKTYRLYDRSSDRVREAFHPFRKKYHRPFNALRDISFSIERGEAVGIIGRNGSGKSTLLQVLCNVLQPTTGTVRVNGRISALLELGAGFNPEFTGRENVYLSTAIMGLSHEEITEKFEKITQFADIGEFIDQPVKLYSSGMYVRLAFATAISVDPELLIVDEALAVGDIFFQQKCLAHMREMMANCTILFVTHDMHSVTNLCRRVLLLDGGRLIFDGPPLEGVTNYTKIVHNECYKAEGEDLAIPEEAVAELSAVESRAREQDDTAWIAVKEEDRAGAKEIEILKVRLLDDNYQAKITAQGDEMLIVEMVVVAKTDKQNVIYGYTVKDRIGNAIFGENTCSSLPGSYALAAGTHLVSFKFRWPEVYPQEYILTFGVGEGFLPFAHTIHCWAHNVVSVAAITPGKGVHGIFNNPILDCQACPIADL